MAVWDTKVPWGFMLLLAGAAGVAVNYPDHICAVKGSTVTILCTFTPLKSAILDGSEDFIEVTRVRWCQNHLLCHGTTPSVYDSQSESNDPRYKYLGDKTGNCTLQINDVKKEDEATFRFRMEGNHTAAHYTGRSGVNITVSDGAQMKVNSSVTEAQVRAGENVTLCCTALCTFHQMEVTWFKDSHALSGSGPTLQLGPLTAEDSGSYTCSLRADANTLSPPYRLQVKAEQEGTDGGAVDKLLVVRLSLFALHTVLIITVTYVIVKRMCSHTSSRELKNTAVQCPH
ncbi:B-cell receptor CD22-like [Chaetodon auriga]|uniref:B-cell receptor CD22-like n=1 Tax=Chaetodon auriga TaxID=39042 RepID=UPI004032F80A